MDYTKSEAYRQNQRYEKAMAAAKDAANKQAKANRRTAWSVDDYNLACRTLGRLVPECGANPKAGLSQEGESRVKTT